MKGKVTTESVQTFRGREKGRKPRSKSSEEEVDAPDLVGDHVVIVGVSKGSTIAENYSSVRCDASVQLPVRVNVHGGEDFDAKPIRLALKEAGRIAERYLSAELESMKDWLE